MEQCGAKRNSTNVYTKSRIRNGKVFSTVDAATRVHSGLSMVRRHLINASFIVPHLRTGENVASIAKTLESLFA